MVLSHSHIPKLWPQKTRNRIISRKVMRLCIYIYVYIIEITYFMDYTPVSIDFFKWMSWLRWKTIGKIMKQWTFFWALLISPRSIPRFPQISGWLWGPRPCCAALALETQWIRIRGSVRICGISWRSHPALSDIWGVPKSGRSRRLLTFRRKKHHSKSTHFSRHGLPWEIERTFQWEKAWRNGFWWRFWWSWWMLMGILHQKSVETWGYSAWTEELQGIQLDRGLGRPIVAIPKRPVAKKTQVQTSVPHKIAEEPQMSWKKSLPSGYD